MKLFKKTAALLFCLALVFSVMAISASADDEAELLAAPTLNKDFTVTLTKNETSSSAILNRDSSATGITYNGYEVNVNNEVTFDINLSYAYTGEGDAPYDAGTSKINSFQFDVDLPTGVTVTEVTINSDTITHKAGAGNSYLNTYAYTASGNASNDFTLPSTATSVATVTFKFGSGTTQNTALVPKVQNIELKVDNLERTEKVAVQGDNNLEAAVISTDFPVWVNPQYVATVEHFTAANASGIISKDTAKTYVVYDYYQGTTSATTEASSTAPDWSSNPVLTLNKLECPATERFPGYTFKGWMVTTENASNTWDSVSSSSGSRWSQDKSYSTSDDWATNSSADSLTTTAIAAFADGTATAVNFIPATVSTSGVGSATIPAGYVGNITLTPVYVADVYTATFNAGAVKATFGNGASTLTTSDSANDTYTKPYTIEDLYNTDESEVEDFLDIERNKDAQNKKLARLGYKFVGWTLNTTASASSGDYSADTAYDWAKDAANSTTVADVTAGKTRVNQRNVITMAVAKRYGDIQFTAEWELDIYFAKVTYAYAGSNHAMILVGVPTGTRSAGLIENNYDTTHKYTYKCNDGDATTQTNQAMFKIPADSDQRAAYVTKATKDSNYNTYFNATNLTSSYDIYAYIAPASTTEAQITLDETSTTGNDSLHYDGNVDDAGTLIDVGDFGNVDILYRTVTSDYTSNVFALNTAQGVKSRLQADYTCTDSDAQNFASIADIVNIYNLMGYAKSAS